MPSRRRNGFKPPFPTLQISTWIYLPILMLEFLFFVSPILPTAASIPCTLLFFFFAFACAYYTYMACITDPMDVYLAKHLLETGEMTSEASCCYRPPQTPPTTTPETQEEETQKYCWVCETSVAEHSMHCKYCNKCVSHFDHHCLWLNTCVGSANYTYFYRILCMTSLMLLVGVCCMLGIVIDMFTGGTSRQRANDWFGADLWGLVTGVNVFFLVSNICALSAVAQLLNFHLALQKKNMTTYQFIITDNARRREQFQKREERRSNRVAAISKAQQEGHFVIAIRLQMGQYCCSPCDPLPKDEETPVDANGNGTLNNNNEPKTSGYAELSDEVGALSADEEEVKASMSSETDLAHTMGASLGGSSSSQLEATGVKVLEQQQHDYGTPENPTVTVEEKSKYVSESNGVENVAVDTTHASSNVVRTETEHGARTNAVEGNAQEGEPKQVESESEKAAEDSDEI